MTINFLHKKPLFILVLFNSIIVSSPAFSWNTLADNIDIYCSQNKLILDCEYRLLDADSTVNSIFVSSGGEIMDMKNIESSSTTDNTTAILFMVDTSDPARQNVIGKNKQHIKSLLNNATSGYQSGLSSFDKDLKIESAIDSSTFLFYKSLEQLQAKGKTTELYRNLLKGIGYLKSVDAVHKVIFLLSDGQAEDKAYFHSDVVAAARKFGIIINSIGYPRSVSLSVALQSMRRLSEETGGSYIETDINYKLPDSYFGSAFNNIKTTGMVSVNLENNISDTISLTFKLSNAEENITVPVKVYSSQKESQIKQPLTPEETTTSAPSTTTSPVQIITRQVETQPVNLWLWYGLPAAFIIIIVFILLTLFLLWHRQSEKNNKGQTDYRPYAYLIADNESKTRYPVTRTLWRIGRSKDNELSLNDTSISRVHAEIHRNSDGSFDIIDMNSVNGVYINNEKTGKAILNEGDIIELGDVFLRFTQLASDDSMEESTIVQKTRAPGIGGLSK